MKKTLIIAAIAVLSTSAFAQDLGSLLGRVAGAAGGRAECTATYAISRAGVFGPDSRTETKTVRGRSIGDACQKAKRENDSDSGVFGNSTKYLSSLTCSVRGVSVNVDVDTCEASI